MRSLLIIILGGFLVLAGIQTYGYQAEVSVDTGQDLGAINPDIYGHFIEHLGRCIHQGIWAEILRNRKFWGDDNSDYGVPSPWRAEGETEGVSYLHDNTVFYSGGQSQRVRIEREDVRAGVRQDGIDLRGGMKYHVRLVALQRGTELPVCVEITKADETLAKVEILLTSHDWKMYEATLDIKEPVTGASFRITAMKPCEFWIGAVSLMPDDAVEGMRRDVIEAIRRVHPANVRWPGGNFVSGYHWKDGIGDRDKRPTRMDRAWNAIEPNDFGIDEFMAFCRLVSTKPYVVVNTGNGTAQEAAELVQYCNGSSSTTYGALRTQNGHPEPYNVKLWGIGNEMYGNWQIGHVDAETYARRHIEFAKAMSAGDPTLTLVAVGEGNPRWDEPMFRIAGEHFDLYSYHHYTGDIENPRQYSETEVEQRRYWHIVGMPVWLESKFTELGKFVEQNKPENKQIGLAFDEWNVWLPETAPGIEQDYKLREAIYAAGVFHALHRHNDTFALANLAQLVNVLGAIKTTQTEVASTPLALAFELYTTSFGTKRVQCRTSSPSHTGPEREVPLLDASAALTEDGRILTIALVNRHPEESAQITLNLKGWKVQSKVEKAAIVGESYLAANVPGRPEQVKIQKEEIELDPSNPVVEIPAHGVVIFRIKGR